MKKNAKFNELGFIFELGFNIGVMSFLKEKVEQKIAKINNDIFDFIEEILEQKIYKRDYINLKLTKGIIDENEKDIIKKNVDYLLYKGIICGKNFCREFIKNKVGDREFVIEYFQAQFDIFNFIFECEKKYFYKLLKEQLKIEIKEYEIDDYLKKGRFLKADLLLVISKRNKNHVLVLDNSILLKNIFNYEDITRLKKNYKKATVRKKLKSSFNNLSINSSEISHINISSMLCNYMIGLSSKDKVLFKLVQSGSYAYSFLIFLKQKNIMQDIESICLVGYTDEECGSINVDKENLNLLEDIEEAFINFNKEYKASDRTNNNSSYEEKQEDVFKTIRRNFNSIFNIDKEFDLTDLYDGINHKKISETLKEYQNTSGYYGSDNETFRDVHANKIKKYLNDKNNKMIFLTGNPGIGKTTAIVDYLKNQESYIFIYISPRTQVNKDIEQKFLENNKLYNDDCLYVTANSNDEKIINGKSVDIVNFNSNNKEKFNCIEGPIKFMDINREREFAEENIKFKNRNSTDIEKIQDKSKGVLNRISTAISYVIKENLSNKIVATLAIQSLKSLGKEKSTTDHIEKIFESIYSSRSGFDLKKLERFSEKYKNIIFMVDEITGDESGVAFLEELRKYLSKPILREKSNFKIIVADASITEKDIIKKHLSNKEDDIDKIYYKKVKEKPKALEVQEFDFKKLNSVYINTNSYPAKELQIDYNIYLDLKRHNEDLIEKDKLKERVNNDLIKTALNYNLKENKQVIIYVQDLKRIEEISVKLEDEYNKFNKNKLEKNKDYIIINSTISDEERRVIPEVQDSAKFVIMTSSASRGLSFKNARLLLVDVPRFSIEKNLMEILQLIYRGRGNLDIDNNEKKYVKFFVSENIFYNDEEEDLNKNIKIKEKVVSLITLLMILKLAIETRIYGSSKIKKNNMILVPIGGKSISSSDELLIERFSSLVKNINKERYKDKSNVYLKDLDKSLSNILNEIKIETNNEIYNINENKIKDTFINLWSDSIKNLINFNPFKDSYILGDLAIFKIENNLDSELHFLRKKIEENTNNRELEKIFAMSKNKNLPDTLRNELKSILSALNHFKRNSDKQSMKFIENKKSDERYIAIPLVAPFITKEFKFHEKSKHEFSEEYKFKNLMEDYIKSYYSIGSVLPITSNYDTVPFITFKSNSLLSIRNKMFNTGYLFCCNEINILNLLLMN